MTSNSYLDMLHSTAVGCKGASWMIVEIDWLIDDDWLIDWRWLIDDEWLVMIDWFSMIDDGEWSMIMIDWRLWLIDDYDWLTIMIDRLMMIDCWRLIGWLIGWGWWIDWRLLIDDDWQWLIMMVGMIFNRYNKTSLTFNLALLPWALSIVDSGLLPKSKLLTV